MPDFPSVAFRQPRNVITPNQPSSVGDQLIGGWASSFATLTTVWPIANTAFYIPFYVYDFVTIYQLAFENGATVNGNFDIGIFDAGGNKLVSSGSTAQGTASAIQMVDTTNITLSPSTYFVGFSTNSSTATYRCSILGSRAARLCGVLQQATAFALPATMTGIAPTSSFIPWWALVTNPNNLL